MSRLFPDIFVNSICKWLMHIVVPEFDLIAFNTHTKRISFIAAKSCCLADTELVLIAVTWL